MFARIRTFFVARSARTARTARSARTSGAGRPPQHNVFEAAATYVAASVEDDWDRIDEATGWVAPDALVFGINELACRAVIALARERNEPVESVARGLLGLPGAEPSRPI